MTRQIDVEILGGPSDGTIIRLDGWQPSLFLVKQSQPSVADFKQDQSHPAVAKPEMIELRIYQRPDGSMYAMWPKGAA